MVFCGHCGYQLAPGDDICPRCGAEVPSDLIIPDPQANNPTEISQVIQAPDQSALSHPDNQPGRRPAAQVPQPLIIRSAGTSAANASVANDATTVMNAPAYSQPQQYQPPQQVYPNYPPQVGYGYNAAGQAYYPAGQSAVIAQLLASSRKGKTGALLLILFGLLLLIAAVIVLLLNQQGIIFSS